MISKLELGVNDLDGGVVQQGCGGARLKPEM